MAGSPLPSPLAPKGLHGLLCAFGVDVMVTTPEQLVITIASISCRAYRLPSVSSLTAFRYIA